MRALLHNQNIICPVCFGRGALLRIFYQDGIGWRFKLACSLCKGTGRVELPAGMKRRKK